MPPQATLFAPAERLPPEEVAEQVGRLGRFGSLGAILDAIPSLVLVLNEERQILFGNRAVENLARALHCECYLGLRPGELLACRNAHTAPSGCGTGEGCRNCGAVKAILCAQQGRASREECRVSSEAGEAFDLRVDVSPVVWEGRTYSLVVAQDIRDEKRREVLERVFFHDVLNTAGGVLGLARLLGEDPESGKEIAGDLLRSSEMLVAEIQCQRELVKAETGDLSVHAAPVPVGDVLATVLATLRLHPAAAEKHLVVAPSPAPIVLWTDATLLERVLVNMGKNALEASAPGDVVTIGADGDGGSGEARVWCHNRGVMSAEVQRQVFLRNFSTKGPGRGVGTYSVRLLVERYLDGKVGFTSSDADGTTFFATLPVAARVPGSSAPELAGTAQGVRGGA